MTPGYLVLTSIFVWKLNSKVFMLNMQVDMAIIKELVMVMKEKRDASGKDHEWVIYI